jgi:Ca2+-binding RTX toxin-like protein
VQSSLSYKLPGNVENLTLMDTTDIDGTGNWRGNSIRGNSGDNVLDGKGSADTLSGGGGIDTLIWDSSDVRLGGGSGNSDTLKVNGSGAHLNLKALPDGVIANMERIDLTGSGNNTLTLNAAEILDLSSTSNTLRVLGNSGDTVHRGGGWTHGPDKMISGQSYDTYTQELATLLVDSDITSIV